MNSPGRSWAAWLLLIFGVAAYGQISATAKDGTGPGYPGMDEAVNERMAENAGAAPRSPYIDTDS